MKQDKWNKSIKIFAILAMLFASGCDPYIRLRKHEGSGYPDLYSIATNSIPNTKGYFKSGLTEIEPKIIPIEKDSLGRIMYLYYEGGTISKYSLIISQKSDEEYAYYYPDYNFISISHCVIRDSADFNKLLIGDPTVDKCLPFDFAYGRVFNFRLESVSAEEIEKLKMKNDWNKSIDIDKCEKVEIVKEKAKGPVKNSKVEEFCRKVLDSHRYCSYPRFLTKDNYNRSMYVGYEWQDRKDRYVVMFFQPDGSYDEKNGFMELTDFNNYQDDLKAFKERNSWNVKP
jgi:hypothetical protein